MSEKTTRILSETVLIVIILMIGAVIISVVGLVNNNFFPKKVPTEVVLTKSPLQVTFKGNDKVSVENLVKDAKDFPFVDYRFNTNLNVKIETEDIITDSNDIKMNLTETTTNTSESK